MFGNAINLSSLAENFISSGVNLEVLHRLTAISADALDTLPHSPGLFLTLAVLGLTHKTAYKHVFACSTIVPLIVTSVAAIFCVIFL
jgi:H+/gluconate symporter-like permease